MGYGRLGVRLPVPKGDSHSKYTSTNEGLQLEMFSCVCSSFSS